MYGGKAATVCIYVLTWLRVKQGVSGEIHRFYLALKRESKHAVIECKTGLRSPNASHNGVKSFQKWHHEIYLQNVYRKNIHNIIIVN